MASEQQSCRSNYRLESDKRVALVRSKLSDAMQSAYDETGQELTYGELFAALSDTMASWAKYLRKDEAKESNG